MINSRIADWFDHVVTTGGYKRFEDLHVDDMDSEYRRRDRWIDGAIAGLNAAAKVRDLRQAPFTVAAGFALLSNPQRVGLSAQVLRDVQREFDFSPPSLYVFERKHEPWLTDEDFVEWNGQMYAGDAGPTHAYLREWYDEDEELYHRSFWLAR